MKYGYLYPRVLLNFKRQTFLNLYAYSDYLRLLEEEFGPRRSATHSGAFFGDSERSTIYKGYNIQAGTAPSKKYSLNISVDQSWKNFDYDFGAGPKFPRVSRAALLDPNAPLDPGTGTTLDLDAAVNWRPADSLNFSLNYIKSRLVRDDTKRIAYDQNLYSVRGTYQFTAFTFARARVDYDTLQARVYGQFLVGWAPNPGTSFYAGYNDDMSRNGFNPFTGHHEPGLHRNGRTFFIKMSYLFRRGL